MCELTVAGGLFGCNSIFSWTTCAKCTNFCKKIKKQKIKQTVLMHLACTLEHGRCFMAFKGAKVLLKNFCVL